MASSAEYRYHRVRYTGNIYYILHMLNYNIYTPYYITASSYNMHRTCIYSFLSSWSSCSAATLTSRSAGHKAEMLTPILVRDMSEVYVYRSMPMCDSFVYLFICMILRSFVKRGLVYDCIWLYRALWVYIYIWNMWR